MKIKSLWLLALGLGVLCVWLAYHYREKLEPKTLVGLHSGAVVFSASPLPALYWGDRDQFGDLALKLKAHDFIDLAAANLEETVRFNDLSYTQIQPGLFLVVLGAQRIFLLTDPFNPEQLNLKVAVAFKSDWVILQRSRLLPDNWPEPAQGWAVLGAQVSERLKEASLASQKPVVRPSNQGTVWLEKKPEVDWQIVKP